MVSEICGFFQKTLLMFMVLKLWILLYVTQFVYCDTMDNSNWLKTNDKMIENCFSYPKEQLISKEDSKYMKSALNTPKISLDSLYKLLNNRFQQEMTGSLERFRKYDPATADRSFIRFGRQPTMYFKTNWSPLKTNRQFANWINYARNLQSKRPAAGEIVKDTSFLRFGRSNIM